MYKDTLKRFNNICEYNFYTSRESAITEDNDENTPNSDGAPMSELPQDSSISPTLPETQDTPNNMDDMSDDMGMDDMPDIDMGDMGDDEFDMDNEIEIDVSDLTDKQDELKSEMSKTITFFSDKFDDIINLFNKLDDKLSMSIEDSKAEIDNIKKEIVKRNPTNTEKLKLRSLDSYPYNVGIDGYWADKRTIDNYDINDSGNTDSEKEYILTQGDIDNDYNENDILKTIDEVKNFKLGKIFNYN